MERLTFPLPDGRMATHSKFDLYVEEEPIPDLPGACKTVQYYITGEIVERLAAYEDTGMEPKDVKGLRKFCETITETTMEHIYELAQAAKEERLLVLPCPIGTPVYVHEPLCGRGKQLTYDGCKYGQDCMRDRTIKCPLRVVKRAFTIQMRHHLGKSFWLTQEEAEAAIPKNRRK